MRPSGVISRVLVMSLGLMFVFPPAVSSAQGAKGAPIKIGACLSLTGAGAGLGIPERNGMQLAVKTINEHGGIGGRPLQLSIVDDASSADTAVSKANALVYDEGVKTIIGATLLASTDAAATVTNAARVPQLALTGPGPAIELTYPYLFHLGASFNQLAEGVMAYISKGLNAKRVGVLYDSGYGQLVFNNIQKLAAGYGVQIVDAEKFEVAATDVTSQAAKVRDTRPDAVIIVATSAIPFRNAKQVGITQPIVGAAGAASYEYVKAMGDAADNITFAEFLVGEDPLPYQAEFVRLYKAEHGALPKGFEGFAWDAVHIVAKALQKAGADASPAQIGEAILSIQPYAGVTGTRNFKTPDRAGYQLSNFVYSKVTKGQWTRINFRIEK